MGGVPQNVCCLNKIPNEIIEIETRHTNAISKILSLLRNSGTYILK